MIGPSSQSGVLFSIGHSNQTIEAFLTLLQHHQIQVLVDVRSSPYSRYVSHFNSHPLRLALQNTGLHYVFLGKKLGGRPEGDEFYDANDHVLYDCLSSAPFFLDGMERLRQIGKRYRAAILCSEENPAVCHRHLLIGRVLRQQECTLLHIRGDGRLQTATEVTFQVGAFSSGQSLWEEALAQPETQTWKSLRPVVRNRPRLSAPKDVPGPAAKASSIGDSINGHI